MHIIWATDNQVHYLNVLMTKIIYNPDTVQRILGRGGEKNVL